MKLLTSLASLPWVVVVLMWLSPHRVPAQDRIWTSRSPSDASSVTGVVLDPANPLILYATSDASEPGTTGIRKSVDGGETWIELGAGDPELSSLTCLAIDPSDSSALYVGSSQGLVASSHDGGTTWTKASIDTNPVSAIAVAPESDSVYAAARPVGSFDFLEFGNLSRSGDGGGTWQATSLADSRGVYALLADELDLSLLAGTDFAYPIGYYGRPVPQGGGVVRSGDAGATWAFPSADLGFSVTALARDSHSVAQFAATSSGQILRSEDDGASWTPLGKLPGTVTTIAADPVSAGTLYAGLPHGGVWRSVDGGQTWKPFDSGLTDSSVRSLAVDPTGRNLYAGTRAGVFHRELPAAAAGTCLAAVDHLCLLGSRFRVDLYAIDPSTQAPAPVRALRKGDRFGYFSFPSLTKDSTLPEVFVKMLDATSLPGQGYWIFSAALTNVSYSLAVTDTTNGQVQLYDGQAFCGTADIHAFPAAASRSAPAKAERSASSAATPASELALLSGRFRLILVATNPFSGSPVDGVAIPEGDRFGYFSLPGLTGDATFPEVFVKMLDATSLPDGDFWLFQSGLTSVPYALTVTDSVTGATKTYRNDPVDPTRLCGSADLRVTGGPAPEALGGDWVGTFSSPLDTTAAVAQFGDRLSIVATTTYGFSLSIDGVLQSGTLAGAFRTEFQGCHFEGDATGVATSSAIEVESEELSSTCGSFFSPHLELTPAPAGDSRAPGDR